MMNKCGFPVTSVKWLVYLLTVAIVFSPCVSTVAWAKVPNSWSSMVRPGVMVGDGDQQDDYFIDYLLPVWSDDRQLIYINPHLRFGDDDQDEENFGIGYRGLFHDNRVIYGGNIFYDTIGTEFDNRFHQLGLGFEALSKRVDFRTNGYIVISDRRKPVPIANQYSFGSGAILLNQGMEEALPGIDAEVSVLLPGISDIFETHVTLGGFYYDSQLKGDIFGWKGRLDFRPIKFLNIALEYNEKNLDGNTEDAFFVGGYLEFPLGKDTFKEWAKPAFGARSLEQRMTEKVVRDRHIKTIIDVEETSIVAADAIFVNLDNESQNVTVDSHAEPVGDGTDGVDGGTGSLQDPYWHTDLITDSPLYADGAYVYVFSYDDEADEYGGASVPLLDNMTLWGEGYYNPAWAMGGGPYPILTGGEECVILANNNEVMGLEIAGCGEGIAGYDIMSTNIHHNIIHDNYGLASGIHIENYFEDDTVDGLNLNYNISNNEIYNNPTGVTLITQVFAGTSISNTSITNIFDNNNIYNNVDGVYVNNVLVVESETPGSDVTASIASSNINNIFTNNDIYENEGSGVMVENLIRAEAYSGGSVDGSVIASVDDSAIHNVFSNNNVSDNSSYGILVGNPEGGCGDVICYPLNTILAMAVSDSGTITGDVSASVGNSEIVNVYTSNITNGNGYDGISENNFIGSVSWVQFAPDTVNGNVTSTVTDSRVSSTFTDNVSDWNEGLGEPVFDTGIYSETELMAWSMIGFETTVDGNVASSISGSAIEHTYTGNQVSDNYTTGIYEGNTMFAMTSVGDSFFSVGGNATSSVASSSIDSTYSGNTVERNEALETGIHADSDILAWTIVDNSSVEGNAGSSVSDASVNYDFTGNNINDNGGDGINADAAIQAYTSVWESDVGSASSSVNLSAIRKVYSGNTVTGNWGTGINSGDAGDMDALVAMFLDGEVPFSGDVEGNAIIASTSVGGSDVYGSLTSDVADSSISRELTDNTVDGNDDDGVDSANLILSAATADETDVIFDPVAATTENSSITNKYSGNSMDYNNGAGVGEYNAVRSVSAGVVDMASEMSATTSGSSISSTFNDNSMDENFVGIDRDSILGSSARLFETGQIGVGDLTSTTENSSISGSFTGNSASDNVETGIDSYSNILADVEWGQAWIHGTISESTATSSISDTFTDNTVMNNGGDATGISLRYEIYPFEESATSWVNLFMQGNEVVGNWGYGLYMSYNDNVAALFTGDLGGGALGSTGGNSFYGNDTADVYNETFSDVSAQSNWWGQDTGPAGGQIVNGTGATTDAGGWLTSDPN